VVQAVGRRSFAGLGAQRAAASRHGEYVVPIFIDCGMVLDSGSRFVRPE
jgi:hypothetical protein